MDDPLNIAAGRARRVALLRFFEFSGLVAALTAASVYAARGFLGFHTDVDGAYSMTQIVVAQTVFALVGAVIPTAIMIVWTREPATYFGWGTSLRWRHLAIGTAAGAGLLTLLLSVMALCGGYSFGTPALTPARAVAYGAVYLFAFAMTAVTEEGMLRGYALVQLSRAISFWPAAVLLSGLFLVLHMGHKNETAIGLAQAGLVGLILAYSFRRSGSLWFAIGFHAAWDFAQSFVYGVPDSGTSVPGALLRPVFHGPNWLTGGPAGPEGSLLTLPILGMLAWIAHATLAPGGLTTARPRQG